MTDNAHRPADDDELLSAYLADELDSDAAASFEARLQAEPALAARLDALADALVALGGFDTASLPDGFDERLDERLHAARRQMPTDLATARRRRDGRSRWVGIGTAAAVLLLAAVVAGPLLRGMQGGGGADMAEVARDEAGGDAAQEGADGDSSRTTAPVLLSKRVTVADEDALRRRYENLPEAQGLVGVSLDDATQLASRFTAAVDQRTMAVTGGTSASQAAAPDDAAVAESGIDESAGGGGEAGGGAGSAPAPLDAGEAENNKSPAADPCLATITAGAQAPLVPVRVEPVRYEDQRAVAYVFVTASPDSDRLDRTEVWVVARKDCTTLVFQQY